MFIYQNKNMEFKTGIDEQKQAENKLDFSSNIARRDNEKNATLILIPLLLRRKRIARFMKKLVLLKQK